MAWNSWIKRQTNQYLQYSVSTVVEVHAERNGPSPQAGAASTHRRGGDPRGPQSGWAYASWRVGLVQNQQNKARPTWVSPSQDRIPSVLTVKPTFPIASWPSSADPWIRELEFSQPLPARFASYSPSPPGKALRPLSPAGTPQFPQPASHWALLFPSFLVLRFVC